MADPHTMPCDDPIMFRFGDSWPSDKWLKTIIKVRRLHNHAIENAIDIDRAAATAEKVVIVYQCVLDPPEEVSRVSDFVAFGWPHLVIHCCNNGDIKFVRDGQTCILTERGPGAMYGD